VPPLPPLREPLLLGIVMFFPTDLLPSRGNLETHDLPFPLSLTNPSSFWRCRFPSPFFPHDASFFGLAVLNLIMKPQSPGGSINSIPGLESPPPSPSLFCGGCTFSPLILCDGEDVLFFRAASPPQLIFQMVDYAGPVFLLFSNPLTALFFCAQR